MGKKITDVDEHRGLNFTSGPLIFTATPWMNYF